jgi:DNA-binding beta-propeller fold protein YncE
LRDYFERTFHRPTDVAFGLHGEIYVSDGYVNSRVEKFDPDGNFIKEWGQRGTGPGEFHTPHSIVTDAKGTVYVADSNNHRIQIFDPDGNFLKEWTQVAPAVLCITPPPNQVLFVIGDTMTSRPIYKIDLDGNILGRIGPRKKFDVFHGMACPSEKEIFLSDVQNWQVDKVILHPTSTTAEVR